MNKIILSKVNMLKAIFGNININTLYKLLSSPKTLKNIPQVFIHNIPVFILNKVLIALDEDDTTDGGVTSTIIGKMRYKKNQNIIESIPIKKTQKTKIQISPKNTQSSPKKTTIIKNNFQTSQKSKNVIHQSNINISKQKKLITQIITITPTLPKKTKLIMNTSKKTAKQDKKPIKSKTIIIKPKKIKSSLPQTNTLTSKQAKPLNKKINNQINPNEKPVHIQKTSKTQTKIKQSSNPIQTQPQKPKYKLQKNKSPHFVALFSTLTASLLLGIGLSMIGHKKIFKNIIVPSTIAIFTYGIFAKKTNKTRQHNKQLIKIKTK